MMRALVACALFLPFVELPVRGQGLPHQKLADAAIHALKPAGSPDRLRVTHVSLYKNGVGYLEHVGRVTGDASVRIDLTSAQMNDALQTLTAVDLGGGRVAGVNFNSTTPLAQQLRTLPFSLGEEPSQEELFNALRGARVEIAGSGAAFRGRVLALELRPSVLAEGGANKPVAERRILTVVADTGATRTIELGTTTVVRLLDAGLREDLNAYLAVLEGSRTEGVRHLSLVDRGAGSRELRVSFLSEVPVWKSTYRVLVLPGQSPDAQLVTVQGFSVVDNTTGEDWNNVQLSLIAGGPQSFLQPIAQPVYSRRPEVAVAENAQITPQTHESEEGPEPPPPPPPPGSASADLGSVSGGGPASLFGSPTGAGSEIDQTLRSPSKVPATGGTWRGSGPPPSPSGLPHAAAASPEAIDTLLRRSNAPSATTAAFDDFFAYNLTDPVTIPRNGSALVPILQTKLPAEVVTLWSASVPGPLRALWVTNNSKLTLDRGAFSVVENGTFAGEGLIDPVHPGERRLLSYAADQAVRVTPQSEATSWQIGSVKVSKGVLHAVNREIAVSRYKVANAAQDGRVVLLETPRRAEWELDAKTVPAETTSTSYRFRVPVAAHGVAELALVQRRTLDESFLLAEISEEQLTSHLRGNSADPKLLSQLQPVFMARRRVAQLDAERAQLQAKITAIGEDQRRLRDNLLALKGSSEEGALVRRYTTELNNQEDVLAALRKEQEALEEQRTQARAELSERLDSLVL